MDSFGCWNLITLIFIYFWIDESVGTISSASGVTLLFSICVELCLGDGRMQAGEETLLQKLGAALDIDTTEQQVITKLMVQRKVVETEKVF